MDIVFRINWNVGRLDWEREIRNIGKLEYWKTGEKGFNSSF